MAGVFDFKVAFEKVGGLFTKRFRRSFETQTDLEGRAFAKPAPATLKQRARLLQGSTSQKKLALWASQGETKGKNLKGKAWKKGGGPKAVPITRLYVTHDLALRGFRFDARKEEVRLFVADDPHIPFYGTEPRLSDIIRWNSKGQPKLNPRVGGKAPLVWPMTPKQVEEIQPEYKFAYAILERAAAEQMKSKLKFAAKLYLNI